MMTYSVKILCLTACLVLCTDAKTRTTFIKIPKTLYLAGLKCARDHYTTDRAVRYNLLTGECETLDNAWFSDQTIDKNFNYYKQSRVDILFKPSKTVKEYIPEIHFVGLSVIMYVQPLANLNRLLDINFETRDGTQIGFHLSPRSDRNMTIFNTYNHTWGSELKEPYLFLRGTSRIYKLEFKINSISIRI